MKLVLCTLGAFVLLTILAGVMVNHICQKEGYNPPSPLVGLDRLMFFIFVNDIRKKTDNATLKWLITLYNLAHFTALLLVGLTIILSAL